ncbi:hypothetical protein [Planomicrobium sp. MB-3u-38]|uniref:hypothetical protein n=1 Tax=Planomicrobium sp. MB-3u-38 TaxID=2058318 RepID=UPI000C7DEA9A|nr:hypothetical protein [Planomicrobium sp. MB-3u-38]PKH09846.1 hypothetical protein CXF70_11570 [Planomicrobium sp. MB-3u-38]
MTAILWGLAAAIFFGITNAIAYQRGANTGYRDGLKTGITAEFQKLHPGEYNIIWGDEDD